jgi:hypothetical protein
MAVTLADEEASYMFYISYWKGSDVLRSCFFAFAFSLPDKRLPVRRLLPCSVEWWLLATTQQMPMLARPCGP